MARLIRVNKAIRKWQCRTGHEIPKGSPYQWYKKAYGTKQIFCMEHTPPRSVYGTNSPYISTAWDIEDGFDFTDMEVDDVSSALEDAASQIRDEIVEALNESAQNMVDGFGHETYQSEELVERAQNYEEWANELESLAQMIDPDEFDADEIMSDIPGSSE